LIEEVELLNPFNPPQDWSSMGVNLGEKKKRRKRVLGL